MNCIMLIEVILFAWRNVQASTGSVRIYPVFKLLIKSMFIVHILIKRHKTFSADVSDNCSANEYMKDHIFKLRRKI